MKIFRKLGDYTKRLETMWEHREALEKDIKFKPDPDEPELTRNEKIKRVIGAIPFRRSHETISSQRNRKRSKT